MSKRVIKTRTVTASIYGPASQFIYYWDTQLHAIVSDHSVNAAVASGYYVLNPISYVGYDWSLIFQENPAFGNDLNNITGNDQIPTATEIQVYDLIPDRYTVITTAALNINPVGTTDQTTLNTYVSTSQDVGGAAVILNDLALENIYVTYSGSGASTTADIQIVASGTNTPIRYCRASGNSSSCQLGDTFSGIPVPEDSVMTFAVIDSLGNVRTDTVRLSPANNYGARWRVQFQNRSDETISCNIYEKGYAGALTDINAGGNPLITNYRQGSNSDAKYDIIKGSEVTLSMMSDTSFQFLDLFTGEEDQFLLIVDRDGTEEWRGFAKNEGYSEAYADTPYEIKSSFIDGLGMLKQVDFLDDNGELYSGIKSQLEIIKICLLYTLHQLPMYVSIDVFEAAHTNSSTTTPLEQTYINLDMFNDGTDPWDCYKVISEILRPYGAHIFQEDGAWHIRSIDNMQTTYVQTIYDAFGDNATTANYNPALALTTASADPKVRIDGQSTMTMIPGHAKVKISQVVSQFKNVIRNGDFDRIDENKKYVNWQDDNNIGEVAAITVGDKSKNVLKMVGDDSGVAYVEADPRIITVSKDGTKYSLTINYIVRGDTDSLTDFTQRFDLQIGPYLLKKNGTWTNDTSAPDSEMLYYNNSVDGHNYNIPNEIQIDTDALPDGGALIFKIYRAVGTGQITQSTEILDITLNSTENAIKLPDKFPLEFPNVGNYTFSEEPIELLFSDWNNFDNPSSMFKNAMYLDAQGTTPTSSWYRDGTTEDLTIQDILGLRIASNYNGPTQEVDGEISCLNNSVKFSNVLSDPNNSGKKFMLSSLTRNEKQQSYSVTMLEVLSEDTSEVFRVTEVGEIRQIENSSLNWNYSPRILES